MPPSCVGPYIVERELGRGGMGEVFLARDPRLDRHVAIKALPAHVAASPERLARFQREARVLASMNHAGIGASYGLEERDGSQLLVLEYIEGQALAQVLARGPRPVSEAISIAGQIAAALAVAHEKGIVHRDLKPGNIMLTTEGRVKVLDFGLARTIDSPDPGSSSTQEAASSRPPSPLGTTTPPLIEIMSTGGYMSPEQAAAARSINAPSSPSARAPTNCSPAAPFTGDTITGIIGAPSQADDFRAFPPPSQPGATCCSTSSAIRPALRFGSAIAKLAGMHRWARDVAIPQLVSQCERILVWEEGRESWTALEVAAEIDRVTPGEPVVDRLRPEFSSPVSITSDPPGARVFAAYYADGDDKEIDLGLTPLRQIPFPRGLSRIRLELPGHRPAFDLLWSIKTVSTNATDPANCTWHYRLHKPGEIPDEMELVPAGGSAVLLTGLDEVGNIATGAFLMDRHPVTNRQFKAFLDDNGYARAEFWPGPFALGEQVISREEAMARLVDTIGHPGPANWELGEFPAGEDDHPVSGVCWHEAAAYAAWAGKTLPTIFHWNRVAFTHASGQIATPANFSGRGTIPVGRTRSFNRFGVHDLAGNVREWMLNAPSRPGQRFILGGGWNDPNYAFIDSTPSPPSTVPRPTASAASAPSSPTRRAPTSPPISVSLSAITRTRGPSATRCSTSSSGSTATTPARSTPCWSPSSPTATPAGRPTRSTPPMAASACACTSSSPTAPSRPSRRCSCSPALSRCTPAPSAPTRSTASTHVKSGRALVLPVFKGTYERGSELQSDWPQPTALYRDHVIMWGRDVGRTVDLIESLPDLDASKLALFGVSWGGALGAIMPAVEPRLRVVILYIAGFAMQKPFPSATRSPRPRIRQPTLMINGEIDYYFPIETSQRPMFEMLGTPPGLKKWRPRPRPLRAQVETIRETLAWLDQHLGPSSLNRTNGNAGPSRDEWLRPPPAPRSPRRCDKLLVDDPHHLRAVLDRQPAQLAQNLLKRRDHSRVLRPAGRPLKLRRRIRLQHEHAPGRQPPRHPRVHQCAQLRRKMHENRAHHLKRPRLRVKVPKVRRDRAQLQPALAREAAGPPHPHLALVNRQNVEPQRGKKQRVPPLPRADVDRPPLPRQSFRHLRQKLVGRIAIGKALRRIPLVPEGARHGFSVAPSASTARPTASPAPSPGSQTSPRESPTPPPRTRPASAPATTGSSADTDT